MTRTAEALRLFRATVFAVQFKNARYNSTLKTAKKSRVEHGKSGQYSATSLDC